MVINRKSWVIWIFFLHCYLLEAQMHEQKKYDTWYRVVNVKISSDGEWNLFYKLYASGKKQAVLLNTHSKTKVTYEEPVDFYLDNEIFFLRSKDEKLQIKNLKSSINKSFEKVTEFQYYKILKRTLLVSRGQLEVLDKDQKIILQLSEVEKMRTKKDSHFVLFELNHQPKILDINDSQLSSLPFDPAMSKIVYSSFDTDKVSVMVSGQEKLSMLTFKGGRITEKPLLQQYELDMQFAIWNDSIISVARPLPATQDSTVSNIEIWDSSSTTLFPKKERYKKNAKSLNFINLKNNEVIANQIRSDENRPVEIFAENTMLWVSDLENESFTRNNVSVLPSLKLIDLKTQKTILQVEKVDLYYVLKNRNLLLYCSDKHWWIYSILTHENRNVTKMFGTNFYNFDRLDTHFPTPVAKPYFSMDYSKVYLTDQHDIWEYDLTNRSGTKITDASPSIRYEIINSSAGGTLTTGSDRPSVLTGNQLILEVTTVDNRKKGLSVWKNRRMINIIQPIPKNIDYVQSNGNMLSFTQENANSPQKLFKFDLLNNKLEPIFTSNEQSYLSESFPRSEIVEWKDTKNLWRDALVILPPHYDKNKKYPVITNIYENKVKEYLHFTPPSYYNGDGFNSTLMALQDYIVILPQIYYSVDHVGESAKTSVEEAIMKINKKYPLDFSNMGLIGHSFGGYETNYIMSHSKMFSTAISGSTLADITADYFTVHEQFLQSNVSRYTNGTFRFSEEFYKNKHAYFQNNPVFSADSVVAPILLWTGKQDYHVNWRQSISMYMALASQKKKVKLLLFKNEAHAILQKDNQLIATSYFIDWFDHYLKEKDRKIK